MTGPPGSQIEPPGHDRRNQETQTQELSFSHRQDESEMWMPAAKARSKTLGQAQAGQAHSAKEWIAVNLLASLALEG